MNRAPDAPIGVEAAAVYCGSLSVSARDLMSHRGLDVCRAHSIGAAKRAVALPDEDAVSIAATCARKLLDSLDAEQRQSIRWLVFATESGLDLSKSAGTYLWDLLDLPAACGTFELKQACHGGVAALEVGAALAAVAPGARVLVVASDASTALTGTYAEPSQGVGAVSMLISNSPSLLRLNCSTPGLHSRHSHDFFRPTPTLDKMDTDQSLLTYLGCFGPAFRDFAERNNTTSDSYFMDFDLLAMHTPFPGMVRGAHRQAFREFGAPLGTEFEADFRARVAPSLEYPSIVGNIYSATTLLAILSAVRNSKASQPSRLGVYSYGSGSTAEFFGCVVQEGARDLLGPDVDDCLSDRLEVTPDHYDTLSKAARAISAGVQWAEPELDMASTVRQGPRARLARIVDYRRVYEWQT
ncbi:MAG: hypothetical protein ABT15_31605 [Pseudonocardia sp. SCN 73-27]|uniref:hydroxymethylglutaryl-CoA synthase family protein n=1 Tax=Pseudonocardia sp. SCN 73-27 TaxID=1660132 RepID=UPI00086A4D19|nr:hydroxymethylglutaryl-CoA synthase [Pseudonocardia sp. SCN 73-27]ODU99469.1 MAG: hypothetical protein ABT15_31605 [Pseudonocardia sp. SCN 73-27]